jgi:hypothetical protein
VGGNAARLPRRQPGSGGCCASDPTMWVRGPVTQLRLCSPWSVSSFLFCVVLLVRPWAGLSQSASWQIVYAPEVAPAPSTPWIRRSSANASPRFRIGKTALWAVHSAGFSAAALVRPHTSSRRSSSDRESLRRQYCGIRNSLGGRSGVVGLSADGARSAQRTLAGEGVNSVQRDVGNVNRLKSA